MKRFDSSKWIIENKYGKLPEFQEKDPDAQAAAAPEGGEGEEEKPEVDTGGGLVDINDGPEAVLAKVRQIPNSILKSGTTDGDPSDEKIQITPGKAIAKDMIPTQNAIGSKQSLWDQVTDSKFGSLDLALISLFLLGLQLYLLYLSGLLSLHFLVEISEQTLQLYLLPSFLFLSL